MSQPDNEIKTLSDALILEIINAVGLPKTEVYQSGSLTCCSTKPPGGWPRSA